MNERENPTASLSEMEDRAAWLREELAELDRAIYAAKIAATGISAGEVVVRRGVEYRVVRVEALWARKPWIIGNPRRKDGSFGTAERNLFDEWERVSAA